MLRNGYLLCAFILLKFLLQYLAIDSVYELHRDEYLHLDLGKHLAWGYASVPPATSWFSWLILSLGNSVFWVKFFPALFGALTILIVWKMVERLGGGHYALILSAVCITFSALLRINTLYQPNSLEYLMWSMVFYGLIGFIQSKNQGWLWFAILSFALGFLNKYNIFFLGLGLLLGILLTPQRNLFLDRQVIPVLAVALLIVAPNLIWQFQHDFPVFHHLSELAERQLVNVNRMDFLKSQLLFFTGAIPVIVLGFISFFRYPPFKKYRFVFWCFLLVMGLYFYLRAKSYYGIGLYPAIIAFGCVYMEHLLQKGWLVYLRPMVVLVPVLIIAFIYQLVLPVRPPERIVEKSEDFQRLGLLRWEDGKDHQIPQDFADMLGWRELAQIVDLALSRVDNPENTLIHCDNYGQAGAINFYSKKKLHEAVSLHADYINWYPLHKMEVENVILVQHASDDDPGREREKTLFKSVILIGKVSHPYARELGTSVYLLQGAKQSINQILGQEIQQRRSEMVD